MAEKNENYAFDLSSTFYKRGRTCFYICWYCSQYYTALNGNFKVEDRMQGFTGLATVMV